MNNKEKGVSLIITFFILTIILAVVLSISVLLYAEIKIMRNIGNSVVAFYSADSGVEKVLYYDRKIIPEGSARGICNICSICSTAGCDPCTFSGTDCANCTDCHVAFTSTMDSGKSYNTVVDVSLTTGANCGISQGDLKSYGFYEDVSRAINLDMTKDVGTVLGPGIDGSGTTFRTVGQNEQIKVSVSSTDQISTITAYIYYSSTGENGTYTLVDQAGLTYVPGHHAWERSFTEHDIGYYYVSIGAIGANGYCASITITPE